MPTPNMGLIPEDVQGLIDYAEETQPAVKAAPEFSQMIKKGFEEADKTDVETLTEQAIAGSYTLQKKGAMEGDQIVDGKLVRHVSDEPQGEVITSYDIRNSPTLQKKGAEAGDQIIDGTLMKSGSNDPLRNMSYAYKEATTITENLANFLESRVPLGRIAFDFEDGLQYISPEEAYGAGFGEGDPEQRREQILQAREQWLAGEREGFMPTDDAAAFAGTMAGSVDVADLMPVKNLILGGAGLGALYTGSEQLAQEGQITPETVAKGAAIGGATGGAFSVAGKAISRTAKAVNKPKEFDKANALVAEVESITAREVASGASQKEAFEVAKAELKINDKQLADAVATTSRKPRVPSTQQRAAQILDNQIATDSAVARQKSPAIDKYLGALSTRIKNISVPVFGRLRKFEANVHVNTATKLNEVEPFTRVIMAAPRAIQDDLNRHLLNGNYNAVKGLIKSYAPDQVDTVDKVIKALKSTFDDLKANGREDLTEVQNYFPRMVKDYAGLTQALGGQAKNRLNMALEAVARSRNKSVADLSIEEKSDVIDKILRGYKISYGNDKLVVITPPTKGVAGGFSGIKGRKLDTVSPELQKFYHSPAESLQMYLRGAVNDIERRKFFGASKLNDKTGVLDMDQTIGSYVAKARDEGLITDDQFEELEAMIQSRFVGGERAMNKAGQIIRDTGYMGTIANPVSAVTQLADLATVGALHGVRNTVSTLFSPKQIKAVDLGIEHTIAEELTNPSKTGRILNTLFKRSGFQLVDRLGKETAINAALRKYQGMAQSEKGRAALRKQWGEVFGDETDALIRDLQNKEVGSQVKELAFHTISDIQPISRLEMPEAYNNNPNARLLYMLKSFTLKQYDIVRREIVQEWKKGNRGKAVRNATVLASYLTAANVGTGVVKDIMQGREVDPEEIPERSLWALLGVYGGNKYLLERYGERGDLKGLATNLVVPPTPMLDALGKTFMDILYGRDYDDRAITQIRAIPVFGPLAYAWFGGGAEAYNERNK